MSQEWMTPQELREYLGLRNRQLTTLMEAHGLPFVRFADVPHARRRFFKPDIDRWVQENPLVLAHFTGQIEKYGYITQTEMIKRLRVGPTKILEWRKKGAPAYKIGDKVYYHPDELADWVKETFAEGSYEGGN